ncbi:hypothetical protein RhiXN_05115 [Rhizoctonia solani]|uniref:Uncharacterized protein n=1 Tax=Rhizoctonia solani TaxID=456999 RepID=A0A8H8SUH9_9AGAM|nr:uncharacterized protein RhiXN_05115 [Rhizoctonia solani]QRW17113.1 hypothetical protein RhiXN_05115 [Rhizoctonia solani]
MPASNDKKERGPSQLRSPGRPSLGWAAVMGYGLDSPRRLCRVVGQDKWCGKHYKPGLPAQPPGGNFPIPTTSTKPLLRFECWPGLRPYVSELDSTGSVLFSVSTVNQSPGAAYDPVKDGSVFRVSAQVDGKDVTSNLNLSVNTVIEEDKFTWSELGLTPRKDVYNLTCTATSARSGNSFQHSSTITYLPPKPDAIGNVVQTDGRTGALLVSEAGKRIPILPFGFYTGFGGYLDQNLTILDDIKKEGYNFVHPVPTFDNATALELVLDRMEELGLWLVYDMRWTYKNLTVVRSEIESVKKRKNILTWYTADERLGRSLDAPLKAAELINELDGYHPVALVLNCQDYYFAEYTAGSQIILQDTYPIGVNATWSTVWNTPCTPELGDCGCDNCEGRLEDIADRVDQYRDRLVWQGRTRDAVVWSVPQAFGEESYWPRKPTSQELALEMLLAINHGSLGIMPWIDSSSNIGIRTGVSPVAKTIPTLTPYILGGKSVISRPKVTGANRIDVTTWSMGGKTLLIALNLNDASAQAHIQLDQSNSNPTVLFQNGVKILKESKNAVGIQFQPLSSIIAIL